MRGLSAVDNVGVRGLLLTQLFTGARPGELWALTWNDINFEKGLMDINACLSEPARGVFTSFYLRTGDKADNRRNRYSTRLPRAQSTPYAFASIMINTGTDIRAVQESLGHGSAKRTLDIYSHAFAETRAAAMDITGDTIGKAAGNAMAAFLLTKK